MTMMEAINPPSAFTPSHFVHRAYEDHIPNYSHFASPIMHPTMGETITSYKHLMNNPKTAEMWQIAFGKDFGGMAQGNNKTGQKGTNSVFIMTWDENDASIAAGHK
jgi:hypothetical protein